MLGYNEEISEVLFCNDCESPKEKISESDKFAYNFWDIQTAENDNNYRYAHYYKSAYDQETDDLCLIYITTEQIR
ncbi:hypothetical protein [Virgibacillus dokdonensis]|uniref:hypothetical protein n=1 Tax=Virgibacillus dokdonensis TaxID=302167 RepID=UPI00098A5B6E|nr:hypothetical protein [Virgibacillus dokdonensis]